MALRTLRGWPLLVLLLSLAVLSGCRGGDGNLAGTLTGKNGGTTQTQQPPADSGTVIRDPEPDLTGTSPGATRPDEEQVAGGSKPSQGQDNIQVPVPERPTLLWESPLTREDGTGLSPGEISGYKVYYRQRHEQSFKSLTLDGPETTQLKLDNFSQGAYEFSVSALDYNGLESRRTEAIPVDLI